MEHTSSRFLDLPDEILQSVLSFVPVQGLTQCTSTCQRLSRLLEYPTLWRQKCKDSYRHWDRRHEFTNRLNRPATSTDWKALLKIRMQQDRVMQADLDSAISTQVGRLGRLSNIIHRGYDSKDILIANIDETSFDAEDVLARKYWSGETLGAVERSAALNEWQQLREDPEYPLERVLGAMELFIVNRPVMSLDELSAHFDKLAGMFRAEHPDLSYKSARQKANDLNAFLRLYNLTGVNEEDYGRLQNNCISVALCSVGHPSLPLISCVIFCCIAKRIGLKAEPCNFPMHVCCIVTPPHGLDLDGFDISTDAASMVDQTRTTLYVDPFAGSNLSINELSARLSFYGIPSDQRAHCFEPCSTIDLLCRTANNIRRFLRETGFAYENCLLLPDAFGPDSAAPQDYRLVNPWRANYGASMVTLLFGSFYNTSMTDFNRNDRFMEMMQAHQALNGMHKGFEMHFKYTDCDIIEKYLLPIFSTSQRNELAMPGQEEHRVVAKMLRDVREEDLGPTAIRRRKQSQATVDEPETLQQMTWPNSGTTWNSPSDDDGTVAYRVGTLFQHKRYRYYGAICGWNKTCQQSQEWMRRMNVQSLPRGSTQAFYHVVADDESERYVAEENIEPVKIPRLAYEAAEIPHHPQFGLLRIAGRYFRRWDEIKNTFVSNVREGWPDD
ncbi:MAG: hypothetical protein M1828_003657 [Chrysothrix sp. TS-e1954]|nr:MAG: hypothetical protein M1828_003657 [Chrysothrix sp. TS-e1954]